MKLLLDSHVLIWWDEDKLPDSIREACLDVSNSLLISVATVWELQIKESLGKLNLRTTLKRWWMSSFP